MNKNNLIAIFITDILSEIDSDFDIRWNETTPELYIEQFLEVNKVDYQGLTFKDLSTEQVLEIKELIHDKMNESLLSTTY